MLSGIKLGPNGHPERQGLTPSVNLLTSRSLPTPRRVDLLGTHSALGESSIPENRSACQEMYTSSMSTFTLRVLSETRWKSVQESRSPKQPVLDWWKTKGDDRTKMHDKFLTKALQWPE